MGTVETFETSHHPYNLVSTLSKILECIARAYRVLSFLAERSTRVKTSAQFENPNHSTSKVKLHGYRGQKRKTDSLPLRYRLRTVLLWRPLNSNYLPSWIVPRVVQVKVECLTWARRSNRKNLTAKLKLSQPLSRKPKTIERSSRLFLSLSVRPTHRYITPAHLLATCLFATNFFVIPSHPHTTCSRNPSFIPLSSVSYPFPQPVLSLTFVHARLS